MNLIYWDREMHLFGNKFLFVCLDFMTHRGRTEDGGGGGWMNENLKGSTIESRDLNYAEWKLIGSQKADKKMIGQKKDWHSGKIIVM